MQPEDSWPHLQTHATCTYWARSIHSMPLHPNSWRPILILSSSLCLGLPNDLFHADHPHQNLVRTFPVTHTCYTPHPSHYSSEHPNNIRWGEHTMMLLHTNSASLITFTKLRKPTISFVMSVRPHWITPFPNDRSSWDLIFEYFSKIWREI